MERLASYIVYDGKQWWAVTGNRALLSDGDLIPREGRLLGLDLDWDETGNHPVKTHSLAAGLKALNASGLVSMAPRSKDHDARLVGLIARNSAGGDLPKDVFREHLLEFDPQLGLALVRHEVRIVRKIDQAYLEATTDFTVERWEEFQEFPAACGCRCATGLELIAVWYSPNQGPSIPAGSISRRASQRTTGWKPSSRARPKPGC